VAGVVAALLGGALCCAASTIRINEVVAGRSGRILRWTDDGVPRLGVGPAWYEAAYDDSTWLQGPGGLGFGDGDDATDVESSMRNVTPSLYIRRTFDVSTSEASHSGELELVVDYDDGFVAYLNGKEVLRKNLGPANAFVYQDQAAYNTHERGSPVTSLLGAASALLVPGENILAVQVHNRTASDSDVTIKADLSILDSTPISLVEHGDVWRYFVGTHEPSGGFRDPAFSPGQVPLNVAWGRVDFDDSAWDSGAGGIGYGDGDDATDVGAEMYNIAGSLYMRQAFVVSSATAGRSESLVLTVDYDDSFIAYLNGLEIARRNVGAPGEFIAHERFSDGGHEAGTPVAIAAGPAYSHLRVGTNVLAVQVHNQSLNSSDLSLIADLAIPDGVPEQLVAHADTWRYFVGVSEPSQPPAPDGVDLETDFVDWVELVNTGTVAVSLNGWSLTDDDGDKDKWVFPDVVIGPGQHIVVCCSGKDVRNPHAPYLHTNFKLDSDGEYIGSYDDSGQLVAEIGPKFPSQSLFHSYGWDEASEAYRFFSAPSPAAANAGESFECIVASPIPDHDSGFYNSGFSLEVACATWRSNYRYTTDGTIPTETNGEPWPRFALGITESTVLRVRAFKAGCFPSPTVTRTFLINQPEAIRSLPAMSIVANYGQAIHKPNGVTSIVGGEWVGGRWQAVTDDDYNIPMQRGRPYERSMSLEFLYSGTNAPVQVDCGIRIAGSNYTRPRYRLQDLTGLWNSNAHANKPQFNVYFRGDYGARVFKGAVFPLSPLESLESIRVRGGKNDWNNPFIIDELVRRLYFDMGQASSLGIMANLFVNGEYKCYYNPCERYDEHFMQESYGSNNGWDIVNHGGVTEGDGVAWSALQDFLTSNDMSDPANYREACKLIDVDNYIDYICLNAYTAMWDWPQNNWYSARERSPYGRYRFYIWDAEGGFGRTNRDPGSYNSFTQDLLRRDVAISRPYRELRVNADFRMVFADRVYKHFHNDGALTDENMLARFEELRTRLDPVMQYYRGQPVSAGKTLNWIAVRRDVFFNQLREQGLLSDVATPAFDHPGGVVPDGFTVSITPPGPLATVYYTIDDTDPRGVGGVPAGMAYAAPFVLDRSRTVKARAYEGGEWSPLVQATYISSLPPLVVSEIMYNAAGGEEYEFIELKNVGSNDLSLAEVHLAEGVTFDFGLGDVQSLPPGGYVVVVENEAAFASRYDTNGMPIAGTYDGRLADGGERLQLTHDAFGTLLSFSYKDGWYDHTDGDGFSLTAVDPAGDTAGWGTKEAWRASAAMGGTPGSDDAGRLPDPGDIAVNEVLTHTDASPVGDWIEIHNTTPHPINIGGWYLSDSGANLTKYCVPAATWVEGGSFVSFDGTNHFGEVPGRAGFGLSELGDEVYLSSGTNAAGELTGFRELAEFGAGEREVTFGRYVRSDGKADFIALSKATRDDANAAPKVGPIVISEIMYGPGAGGDEFLELYNLTATAVPLYDPDDPTNTWRIEGGVDYVFPTQSAVGPFSSVLVVGTNPAAFRAKYGLPGDMGIYGAYSGKLDNAGETVRLYKPGQRDVGLVPYVLVERVAYDNTVPWPEGADGGGPSLERVRRAGYGNDPINWTLSPTGGTPSATLRVDSDGDGMPDRWEHDHGLDVTDGADGGGDGDGDGLTAVDEYVAGGSPANGGDAPAVVLSISNRQACVSFPARTADGNGYEGLERLYAVERSARLTPPQWLAVPGAGVVTGFNGIVTCADTNAGWTQSFYRTKIWLVEP